MTAVAVVTGGASGIGRAVVRSFVDAGLRVAVFDREADAAVELAERLGPDHAIAVAVDVTDAEAMRAGCDRVLHEWGGVDVLCANAGVGLTGPRVDEVSVADFRRVVDVNLIGVLTAMQVVLPSFIQSRHGAVVVVASNLAEVGAAGQSAYVAAKHAALGLVRTAALEYAADGIRVNAVLPGVVDTPAVEQMASTDPERRRRLIARHPMGRFATEQEIAEAVLWLASDKASFVTGTTLAVDGGYLAQ